MSGVGLRRAMHASTAAILLVGLVSDWHTVRVFLHALVVLAVVGEVWRLRSAAFREALAKAVPVFRPTESTKISGASWLVLGYALALSFPAPGPQAGILSAALADPAASFVGSRWGEAVPKSWAGSVAAWVVAAVALLSIGLPFGTVLVGSVGAAGLERVSGRVDDNLVMAPGVAAIAWWFS